MFAKTGQKEKKIHLWLFGRVRGTPCSKHVWFLTPKGRQFRGVICSTAHSIIHNSNNTTAMIKIKTDNTDCYVQSTVLST